MTETTARGQLEEDVRQLVELDDSGLLSTHRDRKLYRAEAFPRLVAARLFVGKRARVVLNPRRSSEPGSALDYPEVQVLAVAERGYGLQCDVMVIRWTPSSGGVATEAHSLAVVERIVELPTR